MKKFIVLALMAAIISTAAFAQGLVLGGYINSGVGVGISNGKDGLGDDAKAIKPFFAARANDAEQRGYRFRFNGQYTNEAKTAGVRFRLQMQGGGTGAKASGNTGNYDTSGGTNHRHSVSTDTGFSVSHAWGWMNFFDGIIQLNGGRIEDSAFATGDFWLSSDSTSRMMGDGVLLKIMPIDGLTLGAGAYVTGRDGVETFQNLEYVKITGHLAYTMKDVFRVDVSYRTDTYEKIGNNYVAHHSGTSGDGPSMLFADVRLLMVKGLTAIIAGHVNFGTEYSKDGQMIFSETFGYKINDDLNVGLNAVQFMSNAKVNNKKYEPGLFFNPWVSYAIGSIVPRLDVVYMMAGRSGFVNSSGATTTGNDVNWYRHGFSATGVKDNTVINVRPSVTINVDNRAKLEIGDSIYFDKYKVGNSGKSLMTNVFYIDMIWSF